MRKGFTLMEMLVVIAVIAILAGIFFVGAPAVMKKTRDSRRIADLKSAQSAVELYYAKCRYYPNNASANDASCGSDGIVGIGWARLQEILVGGGFGISKLPRDPIASKTYYYEPKPDSTGGSAQGYVLGALLEVAGASITEDSLTGTTINGVSCGTANYFCVGQVSQ